MKNVIGLIFGTALLGTGCYAGIEGERVAEDVDHRGRGTCMGGGGSSSSTSFAWNCDGKNNKAETLGGGRFAAAAGNAQSPNDPHDAGAPEGSIEEQIIGAAVVDLAEQISFQCLTDPELEPICTETCAAFGLVWEHQPGTCSDVDSLDVQIVSDVVPSPEGEACPSGEPRMGAQVQATGECLCQCGDPIG